MSNKTRIYLQNWEASFWRKKRSSINPSILQFDYLHMRSLTDGIKRAVRKIPKQKKYRIIDVGCGKKPYLSIFKPYSREYVGVDIDQNTADVVAFAEKLPFKSGSFDLAVSFQTLEHCQYPNRVVSEMLRVLKPGGYALLTTHGVWMYHPGPHDYYRWTHEGLKELFKNFSKVDIKPTLRNWSTLLQLFNVELYGYACRSLFLKFPLYGVIVINNLLGKLAMSFGNDHLTIDYVVIARK